MKSSNTALARLEATIANEKTKFIMEPGNETAIRTTDGTLRHRTHNLFFLSSINALLWENVDGKEFKHQFQDAATAQTWWNQMVLSRAIQKQAAANEMDI